MTRILSPKAIAFCAQTANRSLASISRASPKRMMRETFLARFVRVAAGIDRCLEKLAGIISAERETMPM
jgi:hypothetical protein